jgi:hypothetical protein
MRRLGRLIAAVLDYTAPVAFGCRCWASALWPDRAETEPEVVG